MMAAVTEPREAGWYPAPDKPDGIERYWTGTSWSHLYRGESRNARIARGCAIASLMAVLLLALFLVMLVVALRNTEMPFEKGYGDIDWDAEEEATARIGRIHEVWNGMNRSDRQSVCERIVQDSFAAANAAMVHEFGVAAQDASGVNGVLLIECGGLRSNEISAIEIMSTWQPNVDHGLLDVDELCSIYAASGAQEAWDAMVHRFGFPTGPSLYNPEHVPVGVVEVLEAQCRASVSGEQDAEVIGPVQSGDPTDSGPDRFTVADLEREIARRSETLEWCRHVPRTGMTPTEVPPLDKDAVLQADMVLLCVVSTDPPADVGEDLIVMLDNTGGYLQLRATSGEPYAPFNSPPGLTCDEFIQWAGTRERTVTQAYWLLESRPTHMDADGNGIPCD